MAKLNCWEFKKCERQTGALKTFELGVCPASTETRTDKINGGYNGGRACWAIAGTLCNGKVQGTYALKLGNCLKCDFYELVSSEEKTNFQGGRLILSKLQGLK